MRTVEAGGLKIGDGYPPRIMGVLNVSEESPYDPSVFADAGAAAEYVEDRLVGEGADVVDVGLESANKRFEVLGPEEELARLDTAVEVVESVTADVVWSIETRYHEVADEALSHGFDMVNDICGFADPEMPAVCAEYDVPVVKMAGPGDLRRPGAVEAADWASRRSPAWAERADFVDRVYAALQHGDLPENCIVDPAFGGWSESQTLDDDRETFRRLREFRALDRPILVSINRKNFLKAVADRSTETALPVSLAATSMAVERGAHVVRTHDVAETRDAALIGREFARNRCRDDDLGVEELDVTTVEEGRRHVDRLGVDVDARETVVLTVELTGLGAESRRTLRRVGPDHGLAVGASNGVEIDVGASNGAVLAVGPPHAFERAASAIDGPSRLVNAFELVGDGYR